MQYNSDEVFKKFRDILLEYGDDLTRDEYDELVIPFKPSARTVSRRLSAKWAEAKRMALHSDIEMISANVRLAKERQKFMDSNRIERKTFREYARIENTLEELNRELLKVLAENDISKYTHQDYEYSSLGNVGIIHFTDAHFNELINLPDNKYDFSVASQRCRKLVNQAKLYFELFNVTHVLFAMGGDILNSDRRLEELLSQATNRSKALFLAVDIVKHMLLDLNENYKLTVACVSGNESRIHKDIAWSDIILSDNYDFSVFNMLRYFFEKCDGIDFVIGDNYAEQVMSVGGKNILLMHGNNVASKVESEVQRIKGKYAARRINIDFVLLGHLHSCRIGDQYARSSSLCGANDYSDKGLQLSSRASQNIHIISSDGSMDSVKIDLQNVDDIEGYDIDKELAEYNVKSAQKLHKDITIFKIVI